MLPVFIRLFSLRKSDQLRWVGRAVLVLGIAYAGFVYRAETRAAGPSMEELAPAYARDRAQQIGIMMGNFGMMMLEYSDDLNSPAGQAFEIVAAAGIVALGFFRSAWVLDDDERTSAG